MFLQKPRTNKPNTGLKKGFSRFPNQRNFSTWKGRVNGVLFSQVQSATLLLDAT